MIEEDDLRYWDYTAKIAADTPVERNRVIDFWRAVAILVVVFGHWLAASIWVQPDDEIALMNSLQWIPYAAWVTWLVQVMPVFFFVGGYANARALKRVEIGESRRREWITVRLRRLFTPVIPLLVVWTVLIIVMQPFVPADVVRAGAMSATVPLWFMAVYLAVTAVAPWTHRWWLAKRWWSVAVLAALVLAVDLARFELEVPGIAWVNFAFVWGLVHQVGYWWAERDAKGRPIQPSSGWAIMALMFGTLVAVTWIGLYPVAMVGIPGAGLTNMTPPTFGIVLLGGVQAGFILGSRPSVERLTQGRRIWHGVVAVSGVLMTLYLWHLSAMSLVGAAGIFAFDGAVFRVEPGTWLWWLTRPVWLAVLASATLVLVAVFARFEWRISKKPAPVHRSAVTAGVLLTAGSAAAVAYFGLVSASAEINWMIPISAIVGAALVGAYPVFGHRDDD